MIKRTKRDGSVKRQFCDPDGQLVKVVRLNEYDVEGNFIHTMHYKYEYEAECWTEGYLWICCQIRRYVI